MNTLQKLEKEQKKQTAKYRSLIESKNFEDKLSFAISNDECLLCGDSDVLKHGLCLSCSVGLETPLHLKVLKEYEISVIVNRVKGNN